MTGAGNINYHCSEAAKTANLFQEFYFFVIPNTNKAVPALNCIDNVRNHNDRNEEQAEYV